MVVYKNYDQYDTSNVVIERGLVKQYNKRVKTADMVYIDYGVSILRREVLALIPANQTYSLEQLFPKLIEQRQLLAYEVYERFYQIGSPEGLEEFRGFVSSGLSAQE